MAQSSSSQAHASMDVVAFGAHPDDVELSAGGTLAKLAAQGKRCAIVDLTRGELGTRGSAELRDQEAAASARILGLAHRENLGLADGFFEITEDSLRAVVSAIRRLRPAIVLANALEDRHPDHGRGANCGPRGVSCRPSQGPNRHPGRARDGMASARRVPLHPRPRSETRRGGGHHRAPRHQIRGHHGLQLSIPRSTVHGTRHAHQQPGIPCPCSREGHLVWAACWLFARRGIRGPSSHGRGVVARLGVIVSSAMALAPMRHALSNSPQSD